MANSSDNDRGPATFGNRAEREWRAAHDSKRDRIGASDHFGVRADLEHQRNDADERQKSAT